MLKFLLQEWEQLVPPILSLIQQKDHIVIVNTVYGSTVKFIQNLERFGVESTKIDVSSTEDIFAFVKDNTRMIYF